MTPVFCIPQDEEGHIAKECPGFQDPVHPSENIHEAQSTFPTAEESESTIRKSWQHIALVANTPDAQGSIISRLTLEALQRCRETVGKQHFSGEAALRRVRDLLC